MLQVLRKQDRGLSAQVRWTLRSVESIGLGVAVCLGYFLAARLSLFLQTRPDGVAVFWPAAGVSAGILIALGGKARWPVAIGVIAATIGANLTSDRNVWSATWFALCNAGETLLVAWLLERYPGGEVRLDRLRHVVGLFAAAGVATAVSGVGGAIGYKLIHSPDAPFLGIWRHWFASDAIGILTVAPLMIGLVSAVRNPPPREEFTEGVLALLAIAMTMGAIIFVLPTFWRDFVLPVELLFPLLLWVSARCRPAFTAAAVFIVSLMIVGAITFNLGIFGRGGLPPEPRVLSAQAGILGVTICALILAALFAERRQHAAVLVESEDRMRTIVNTVVDGIITIDEHGVVETLNPAAARIFGYSPEEVVGCNVKMLMPEPYRSEHDGYIHNYLATGETKVIGIGREVSGRRKDGSVFPMNLEVSEMTLAGRRMFTGVVRDITARKRAEEHQALLLGELDHRVKNVLAQVAVVAVSTRQGSRSIGEFLRSLDGRIQSMAAAHTLLSQSGWQSVGLDALVRNQLAPYATGTNISISGTDITLNAAVIQALARVLHELVTNAAKYGALSVPNGRVSVGWKCSRKDDVRSLVFDWQERGGPAVNSESHSSYGTNLIRNLIPHELGGRVDLSFVPEGVSCRIEIPIEKV